MSRAVLFAVLITLLTLVCGCKPGQTDPPAPNPNPPGPKPGAQETGDVAHRNTHFAFDLFGKLHEEKPDENLFVSPLSIAMALSMVYQGAAGTTTDAISGAMAWEGMSPQQVNDGLQALRQDLQDADKEVKLTIADSVWTCQQVPLKPSYLDAMRAIPGTRVESLDFGNPKSADTINEWVNKQTNGLIPTITTPDDLRALWVMLLDAVYFKGRWSDVFSKEHTQDAPFTLAGGTTKTVPMMEQTGEYRYLASDQFQAIRLPYGKEHRFAMYVLLPAKATDLPAFVKSLDVEKWDAWSQKMQMQEGTIKFPRFTAKGDRALNDVLIALGMGTAFNKEKADFSGMSDQKMWIDLVRQKSFLKVDEEGTEAAAVTQVGMVGAAAPPPGEPFTMIVDRPFFLAIVDDDTQAILFMGAIVAPEE